jgi:methylated-DNA-[protein]-cysteine S-methyltransferase
MLAYLDTIEDAPGPVTFAVDEAGALLWLKFDDGRYARTVEQELEREGFRVARDRERTARARGELLEYCAGERRTFDLPLVFAGSAWQNTVWRALTRIPYGETRTYGEVAAMIGHPAAARAVGRANATNRLPLVVPCHRVVGADGSLTGFGGGLHLKVRLLAHEGVEVDAGARERLSALRSGGDVLDVGGEGVQLFGAGGGDDDAGAVVDAAQADAGVGL